MMTDYRIRAVSAFAVLLAVSCLFVRCTRCSGGPGNGGRTLSAFSISGYPTQTKYVQNTDLTP
jgi:hypothetical protein